MEGARTATRPYSAKAWPRRFSSKESAMMACAMGCRPPPPIALDDAGDEQNGQRGRKAAGEAGHGEQCDAADKEVAPAMTEEAQAPAGSTMAFETR